jgi:hypothetical protein
VSIEKTIQDAIIAVLAGDPESLKIDARTVTVQRYLPDQAFKSRPPFIVVERPTLIGKEAWDTSTQREEHAVPLSFIDSCKPTADDFEECQERVDLLRQKFEARLRVKGFLGLARISVMPGMWTLARVPGEPERIGNNLMVIGWTMTVPVIVPN